MPTPDGPQFIEFSDPDGSQFQSLWDSAMAGAQTNLDALSDQDIEAEVDYSEEYDEEPVSHQFNNPQERAFATRHQATYDAAAAMGVRPGEHFYRDLVDRYSDMNPQGPDYSQPDPFDRSDPEEARQAKAIEAMNKLWDE